MLGKDADAVRVAQHRRPGLIITDTRPPRL